MDQYLPLLLLLVLGIGFAAQLFVIPKLLGPSRSSTAKAGPYESGIVPERPPPSRFPVRFYIVSMIFIIFDIEVVFLYPWATVYVSLSTFGLIEMGTFAAVVFVSFAYLVSVGALDWGPAKRRGRPPEHRSVPVVAVHRAPGAASRGGRRRPAAGRGGRGANRLRGGPVGLEQLNHNFLTGSLEAMVKWARAASSWGANFGLACCAIEMMATGAANFDLARFGMEVFRASPRQADVMIVAGRVSQKMAPVLRQVYDQMMEPKWVISMGVCASTGGMFNNYAVVQGVDQVVPVDVYAPGCPPGPETLIHAILTLHERIRQGPLTRRPDQGVGAGIHLDASTVRPPARVRVAPAADAS